MSISRGVVVVSLAGAVLVAGACTGGESTGPGTGSSDGGGSSSGGNGASETCSLETTLSGGVNATLDGSQVCAFTELAVVFAPLGGKVTVNLSITDPVERNQTGTFRATMEVRADDVQWSGAECSVEIESNTLAQAKSNEGGVSFDQYLLRGKGSCSTPATQRAEAGTPKEPVSIAPFTFVFTTLFY